MVAHSDYAVVSVSLNDEATVAVMDVGYLRPHIKPPPGFEHVMPKPKAEFSQSYDMGSYHDGVWSPFKTLKKQEQKDGIGEGDNDYYPHLLAMPDERDDDEWFGYCDIEGNREQNQPSLDDDTDSSMDLSSDESFLVVQTHYVHKTMCQLKFEMVDLGYYSGHFTKNALITYLVDRYEYGFAEAHLLSLSNQCLERECFELGIEHSGSKKDVVEQILATLGDRLKLIPVRRGGRSLWDDLQNED